MAGAASRTQLSVVGELGQFGSRPSHRTPRPTPRAHRVSASSGHGRPRGAGACASASRPNSAKAAARPRAVPRRRAEPGRCSPRRPRGGSTKIVWPEPGAVVDDAGNLSARGSEDGQTVAIVAKHDDGIAEASRRSSRIFSRGRETSPRRRRSRRRRIGGELRRRIVGSRPSAAKRFAARAISASKAGAARAEPRAADPPLFASARRTAWRRAPPARWAESPPDPPLLPRSRAPRRGAKPLEAGQRKPPVTELNPEASPDSARPAAGFGLVDGGAETKPPPVRAAFGPGMDRAGGRRRTRGTPVGAVSVDPGLRSAPTFLRKLAEHLLAGLDHLALALRARLS